MTSLNKKKVKKIKKFLKALAMVVGCLVFIIVASLIFVWVKKNNFIPERKIRETGEKIYACTQTWGKDRVIENCKWYSVYEVQE